MPELPEVETVKNTLIPLIINKTIIGVDIFYDRLIQSNLNEFKKNIINKKIINVSRYGKYLFFSLSDDYILVIHLRMEGKFLFSTSSNNRKKETSLIFYFSDNSSLTFNDTRKFGLMYLGKKDEIKELKMLKKLGVEGNKIEIEKDFKYLKNKFNSNKPIKELLLDQSIICGIGNIYADEILYSSKINPFTKGKYLNDEEIKLLITNCKNILNEAIELGGSTVHSFSSNGIDGKFQNKLMCYGKQNEICPNCGTTFHKSFIMKRGTTYCPNCQINPDLKKALGITGPIGSGKSTCLKYLSKKGFYTVSADKIVHELYHDSYVNNKISKILGFKYNDDSVKDHKKAREILIKDKDTKKKIEEFIYPLVEEKLIDLIKNNEEIAIEVPLLFKAHFEYLFKKIIVIKLNESKQIKNLESRKDNINSMKKINNDYSYNHNNNDLIFIENNGSIKDFYKEIDKVIEGLNN